MADSDALLRALVASVAEAVQVGNAIVEGLARVEAVLSAQHATAGGRNDEEALWTVDEVVRFTALKKATIYEKAANGTLPCLRIGSALRFEPDVIKRWARGTLRSGSIVPIGRGRT